MMDKVRTIEVTYIDDKKETIKNPSEIKLEEYRFCVKMPTEEIHVFVLANVKKVLIQFRARPREKGSNK
jgi:hypothetical protein